MSKPASASPASLRVLVADRFLSRAIGLLARARLHPRAGLWLSRCAAVHTFGMRMAIDIVFVDRACRILRIVPSVAPGRVARCAGADAALELQAGTVERHGWQAGDRIVGGPLRESGRAHRQWRPIIHEPHRRTR